MIVIIWLVYTFKFLLFCDYTKLRQSIKLSIDTIFSHQMFMCNLHNFVKLESQFCDFTLPQIYDFPQICAVRCLGA